MSLQPGVVKFWYFKLRLIDLSEYIVWNIKGLYETFLFWISLKQIYISEEMATIRWNIGLQNQPSSYLGIVDQVLLILNFH